MLDVIANLESAHGLSLIAQATMPGVFLGYARGAALFNSDQSTAAANSACGDLTVATIAYDGLVAGGSVARTAYNQWRSVVLGTGTRLFVRRLGPGDLRVAGTDFSRW